MYVHIEQSMELIFLDDIKYEVFKNSTLLHSFLPSVNSKLEIKEKIPWWGREL